MMLPFFVETSLTDGDSLIHLYFVARQLSDALTAGPSYPVSCPQCQHGSFSVGSLRFGPNLKQGYAPLLDGDGEPRTSNEERRASDGEAMV
jgi:hypothetical protein